MDEIDRARQDMIDKAERGLQLWIDSVTGQAILLAPIEEGTLRATGHGEVARVGPGGLEGTIRFSTVYAARQHEELDWEHPLGGQAKYLEAPFKAALPLLAPTIEAAIRS